MQGKPMLIVLCALLSRRTSAVLLECEKSCIKLASPSPISMKSYVVAASSTGL
jgi:hypothetical protein